MIANPPQTPPVLNELEQLGALSARLAHSLSNHLAVITGNLFLATTLEESEAHQLPELLQAALQAGNRAGSLLARFVEVRRSALREVGSCSASTLLEGLSQWTDSRQWTLAAPPPFPPEPTLAFAGSWEWLAFALDAIVNHTAARPGAIQLALLTPPASTAPSLQLTLTYPSTLTISWENLRDDFTAWSLLAALELLTQMRITPASRPLNPARQQTTLTIPLL